MGDVAIAQGRVTTAETYYQAALAIQRQLYGESKSTVKILMKIGTARQKEGLFTNAIITFREAIQIAKKLPNGYANIFTPDQLSFYADAAIDLSKNLPSDLDKQGLFAEVFDAFQMQKSSAVEKTLLMSSVRMMSSNPQMRDLVEKLQSAERIRDTDKTQLAAETALLDDQRSKLVEDRLITQIEQKNQEILRYQQELQANHPNYLELTKTKPVLINELQSFLTPNEAIALFLLGTQSSYIQLITRSEIQLAKIEQGDQAIHEDVKSLRKALEIEGGSVKEFDLNKSYTVYKALFGQVEKQFKNIDHLIVVPTGPLASLPFSILVTKPIAGVDYSKAEWLVKQLAITHTPSLKSFFEKRSTVQLQQASKVFLGFGKYEKTVKEASLNFKNIHYHPIVKADDIIDIAKSADVGLLMIKSNSLSYYYCLPNKLFEYAFSKIYILSSDFPDLKQIIEEFELGVCIPPQFKDLKNKIIEIEGQLLRPSIKNLNSLSWEFQSEKIQKAYKQLIKK